MPMADIKGPSFVRRSPASSRRSTLRSPSGPTPPKGSWCCPNAGWWKEPWRGSGDAAGWPRTGNVSTTRRAHSCSSPRSALWSEGYAAPNYVSGQTLRSRCLLQQDHGAMSEQAFPHLFQPLKLRHKTLKHRLVFGAHTANMSVEGLPSERHLGYYRERARGGAAMIVIEPAPVHKAGVLTRGNFRAQDDAIIAPFRRITDTCHEHGTVMIHQMYHVGAHGDWDNSFDAAWSPSGLPSMHDSDGSHRMSAAEIAELVECFGQAARRDREAGFDGSEIMAAYNA